jgi:hypothetical protein
LEKTPENLRDADFSGYAGQNLQNTGKSGIFQRSKPLAASNGSNPQMPQILSW